MSVLALVEILHALDNTQHSTKVTIDIQTFICISLCSSSLQEPQERWIWSAYYRTLIYSFPKGCTIPKSIMTLILGILIAFTCTCGSISRLVIESFHVRWDSGLAQHKGHENKVHWKCQSPEEWSQKGYSSFQDKHLETVLKDFKSKVGEICCFRYNNETVKPSVALMCSCVCKVLSGGSPWHKQHTNTNTKETAGSHQADTLQSLHGAWRSGEEWRKRLKK